ncbi:DUF1116 domain-containing protein [Nocardioides hungaricus]
MESTTIQVTSLPDEVEHRRRDANEIALARIVGARPHLVGVAPAGHVVPGMAPNMILTSGAPLSWPEYSGGQRRAIIFAALYEGLAGTDAEAEALLDSGDIVVSTTQSHSCIGSVAGIYTASMPVLIVRNDAHGNSAFCNLYEGKSRYRLNYGAYNAEVRDGLQWLENVMAPVLANAIERSGPIPLQPLMARALRMGDELHSRNTAGTLLLQQALATALLDVSRAGRDTEVREVLDFLAANDYTFLRVGMAAAKVTADAAHGIEYSSIVTGMAFNCREFAVRTSGLGDHWARGGYPELEGRFFDGFTAVDAEWIGGESCVTETIGLGGFAQACAPTLMDYQGGSYARMVENNSRMYEITVGEHPEFLIPSFEFRGTPVGIDLFKVLDRQITPVIDGGLAGRGGGQIGAGVLHSSPAAFEAAALEYLRRYVA